MSEVKPPEDPELKNIIDKLANFVARNGPEFENMTKQKQQGNHKFSFLFSGEHFNYYRYKVASEQAVLQNSSKSEATSGQQLSNPKQFQQFPPPIQPLLQQALTGGSQAPPTSLSSQTERLEGVIQSLREQIGQSESNLSAQFHTIMQQQQKKVEERLIGAKMEGLERDAKGLELSLDDLARVLQPVISSCTKDSISSGKAWIMEHLYTGRHGEVVVQFILERLLEKDSSFEHRLHLIYLINDLVHHCSRKGFPELIESIEKLMVVPAFAFTYINSAQHEKNKMNKLLTLWENHKYFKKPTIDHLKDPNAGLAAYQAQLISCFPTVVGEVSTETNDKMQLLQRQHNEFVCHIGTQISVLQQQQKLQININNSNKNNDENNSGSTTTTTTNNKNNNNNNINNNNNNSHTNKGDDLSQSNIVPSAWLPARKKPQINNNSQNNDEIWNEEMSEGPLNLPDLTKPPPGFPPIPNPPNPPIPPPELDLVPNIPYYDLPAGLIVPLVKLEDCDYTPLDPGSLRLPPPMPPTERLLAAVEAFYAPPSHERPRDADGWEKLALFEFFKAKNKAKAMKSELTNINTASAAAAATNINNTAAATAINNNTADTTITDNNTAAGNNCNPNKRTFVENKKNRHKRSRSHSSSPREHSQSRSPSANNEDGGEEEDESVDPFYQSVDQTCRLQEDNKGHQLMKKMGWGGGALGTTGVGILDPIEGGEVRDKIDQFRGLGMQQNDPFENYRKSMSSGFNVRMKERLDHRSTNQDY